MARLSKLIVGVSLTAVTLTLPTVSHADQGEYTVQEGDTLSGIALRHDVSLSSLLELNGLRVTSLIMPGMELSLPDGAASASGAPTTPAQRVVDFALAQVGKPYVFFTKGPSTFDCSGLTLAAYSQVGIPLIHQAAAQAQQGQVVDHWNEAIRTGDLIFLDGDWDGVIDHVGIALGATTWVQASQSHDIVMTGPIPSDSVIVAVRRYLTTD